MNRLDLPAYEVVLEENLTDIHSRGTVLRHRKTGARVMVIENDDTNKVFNIAFRTPPWNSTGVPHILEHSVLCGSREFPLKDPFVELVKGSLNTFLNAMTYPDKTTYPVASCNDQDFQNLMHVYLDAVFYPNIYQREEIFRQEGWSYHLETPEGPLTYNGVVYNEMKGAFSSADDMLERKIMDGLFPDTTYGRESGGDPEHIPELSYEEFLDFHRRYYHPSNSFLYLYGNMDAAEKLRFIDEKYLSAFDRLEVDSHIDMQEPFAEIRDITDTYPIAENEETENNTYLSYNMTVAKAGDMKTCIAYDVLDYALLSAPGAPLKKALLDRGIGEDVYGSFDDGILQPYFTIVAKGTEPEKKEAFVSTIREILTECAEKGIDRKAIAAALNRMEFSYREADYAQYPKGLMYCLDILETWLYSDEKPFAEVQALEVFDELKREAETGYFEELLRKGLLESTNGCILTLVPEKGMTSRKERELEEKLEELRTSFTAEELEDLVRRTEALEAYQEEEETPEALACIPMLSRSDIRREVDRYRNEELEADGSLLLYHDVTTNGIAYLDLLFEMDHLDAEMLPYLGLLKSVLGMVDTENFTYGELANEINAATGGISYGVEIFEQTEGEGDYHPMFGIRGKSLNDQIPFLFSMIREILTTSRLGDAKRLREIVAQIKSRSESSLANSGHLTAVSRAFSYASEMAKYQDLMSGVSFCWFIEDLERHFDERKEETAAKLFDLLHRIFRPENLKLSFTGEREALDCIRRETALLKDVLYTDPVEKVELKLELSKENEGFKTSGQVQYVAQVGNFRKAGYEYTGAMDVLKVIMGYDYLWTNIRVKGGAYGCMNGFRMNGEAFLVSYRDPHLKRTLGVFRGIPEYLRSFDADEQEMTKYIIGTISGKDVPKTPQMIGNVSKNAYFCGMTEEIMQKVRDQILDATADDIRALADVMEAVLADELICVVGSENCVDRYKELLMSVKPLTAR